MYNPLRVEYIFYTDFQKFKSEFLCEKFEMQRNGLIISSFQFTDILQLRCKRLFNVNCWIAETENFLTRQYFEL